MKKWLPIFLITLTSIVNPWLLSGQDAKPRILGVVMGISKYQNVPSLRFADKDAMSFYNFLLSPAGGGADTNNIRLLLNEKATSYNFFEAMDNLLDMAKEGDQVYIYFAGHGDIEKKTERQNGFLIGYNAPPNCYAAGGCISVRFLQDYVETLVSKNKSKVTLIIDACRSGKLAGGAEGAEITALALKAEWKGVTKILSCQPGETSLESEKWGGGGGVFTYFMLKGLLGQADEDGDGQISVRELDIYLDKNVTKATNNKQIPEIVGDKRQDIARVDKKSALGFLNQMELPISLPGEKQSSGFETDISSINDIFVLREYVKFKEYINNNNLISYNDIDNNKETALSIFSSLEGNPQAAPIVILMKGELLAALQNSAQNAINSWLNSDLVYGKDSTFRELKAAYDIIDSTNPQYNQIKYKYLFWSQYYAKDDHASIKILEEALKISPDEPTAYINMGHYYHNQKIYNEALRCYNKAIELAKNWSWAWSNKGMVLSNMGKFDEALKCYDKAIELKKNSYIPWFNKGNALNLLGKNEEALKCYDKAIDIDSNRFEAYTSKGLILVGLNKNDEAINCYDKAIEINPLDDNTWRCKGIALQSINPEEAIKCFDKAIEINPKLIDTWFNKAYTFFLIGKPEEELKCLDKIIEINPNNSNAWDSKSITFLNMERFEEALKCADKVIEINPKSLQATYRKGIIYTRQKKYDEAFKWFDKVLEIKPDDFTTLDIKGYYLFKSGNHDEGMKAIDKALEINSGYANAWYNKACCNALIKNKPEMLKYLKKAIEMDKEYKAYAPKDEDFKEYWNDPDFKKLVE